MTWQVILDVLGATLLLVGALLCLAAALGLLRFPDVLSRTHAATKPQTLGMLCVVIGLGLWLRDPTAIGLLILAGMLQLMTIPVASHLVGRAACRTGQFRTDLTSPDEFADDLTRAGYRRVVDEDQ
jgi:multicomponent Na+:H+ antiporter subunit G